MSKRLLGRFLLRWLGSTLGLYVAAAILGNQHLSFGGNWYTLVISAFFLALLNMVIKPVLIILSIPAIIITLGLFMLVVNGLVILITSWIYSPLYVSSLWSAILAGIILAIVNFLVSLVLKDV